MSIRKRLGMVVVLAGILAAPALAEDWAVGASIGLVNDVEGRFRLDEFDPRDGNAWVDFRIEDRVLLRGTLGSMKTRGDNAGRVIEVDGEEIVVPDLKERIDYTTLGVSYQFWEGDYTSGVFGGVGGYKIDPDPAPAEFSAFRDASETVWGWHIGVEGDLRVLARLSIVGRVTYHNVRTDTVRSLVTANAGAVFHF